mmetsp:Transcript_138763/g.241301  ORF Transcript_138763/g.241301 Transcript_138763/m.241301 type:complete len:344 (-) Transcript_138763:609-1640(-)
MPPPKKKDTGADDDDEKVREKLEQMRDPEFHKAFIRDLPKDERTRVYGLMGIQKDYAEVHAKYMEEMKELEIRYEKLYSPYYAKRKEIVQGLREPTEEEVSKGSKVVEVKDEDEAPQVTDINGIPEFWYTALKNHEALEEILYPQDEECLKSLIDITAENFEDPNKGFKLTFFFGPNDYFTNTELTKTYHLVEEDEIVIEKCVGSDIDWKPGKDLTMVTKKKKQKHKGGKNTRVITTTEPCESFFNFFKPPQLDDDDDARDDDEMEELEELVEQDYEIGRCIKDRIIPRAVDWFTGEAMPTMEFDDMMGAMGGMGGDDDDDDDDEGAPRIPGAGGENPECKQQ